MRALALMIALTIAAWSLYGCTSEQRTEEVRTYQCPTCKETIKWTYHPTKKWIKTGKEVVHHCPSCKKEWGANLSMESTCAECGTDHLECPICKGHG